MFNSTRLFSLITFLSCLVIPLAASAVPLQLAHHGTLYDTVGGPVTGSVEITFSLWDAGESGSQVWNEVRSVDIVDGVYSTLLGSESAVDAVLRAEPALWLQMSIGGEALVPRHPVASAPYAIVADTAINVDGGTVNATSVTVGGTEVIDATGSWTGGPGSIDWTAVGFVPLDLLDGDADTLGGLACADGDRAVYDPAGGQWVCGTSQVTLDRLDGSAATSGDVLTWNGLATAWSAAGAGSGPGFSNADVYEVIVSVGAIPNVALCLDVTDILLTGTCRTDADLGVNQIIHPGAPTFEGSTGIGWSAGARMGWRCQSGNGIPARAYCITTP